MYLVVSEDWGDYELTELDDDVKDKLYRRNLKVFAFSEGHFHRVTIGLAEPEVGEAVVNPR